MSKIHLKFRPGGIEIKVWRAPGWVWRRLGALLSIFLIFIYYIYYVYLFDLFDLLIERPALVGLASKIALGKARNDGVPEGKTVNDGGRGLHAYNHIYIYTYIHVYIYTYIHIS